MSSTTHRIEVVYSDQNQTPTKLNGTGKSEDTGTVYDQLWSSQSKVSKQMDFVNKHLIWDSGKTLITGTLGRVGDFTGDYAAQNQISSAMSLAGMGIAMAMNPVVGTIALVTRLTSNIVDESISLRNQRIAIDNLRDITNTTGSNREGRRL